MGHWLRPETEQAKPTAAVSGRIADPMPRQSERDSVKADDHSLLGLGGDCRGPSDRSAGGRADGHNSRGTSPGGRRGMRLCFWDPTAWFGCSSAPPEMFEPVRSCVNHTGVRNCPQIWDPGSESRVRSPNCYNAVLRGLVEGDYTLKSAARRLTSFSSLDLFRVV